MYTTTLLLATIHLLFSVIAIPLSIPDLSNPAVGPQPGQSSYYSTYAGKGDAFPANITRDPVMPTASGPPGPDDILFQNLLQAEWAIYSFYQQGVEVFNTSAFVEAGFPNTTYNRIVEIRDNEAGHLRIFQDQISNTSVKNGACEYEYGFTTATSYMALQTYLELASMAFLTGLVLQGKLDVTKSALLAVAETETRHNTWSMIDVWKADPFAGPTDTVYPYANQVLDLTNQVTIPDSCPSANPLYPNPGQHLPTLNYETKSTTLQPGSPIELTFPNAPPSFDKNKPYYAVTFHGLYNISTPFDPNTNMTTIPPEIEADRGIILMVLADEIGAPTQESVVAGPLIIVAEPFVQP